MSIRNRVWRGLCKLSLRSQKTKDKGGMVALLWSLLKMMGWCLFSSLEEEEEAEVEEAEVGEEEE